MRKYPLEAADVISQENLAQGRTNLVYNYKVLTQMVNSAFYDGFLLAQCGTKEEFDGLSMEDRMGYCAVAKATLAEYQGREDHTAEDILKILEEATKNAEIAHGSQE